MIGRGCVLAFTFLVVGAAVAGCSDDKDGSTGEQKKTLAELAACDEGDFVNDMPWSGSAIDAATGKLREPLPAGYVIASTVGWPKQEFRQHIMEKTIESIGVAFTYKGMIAASFGNSPRCGAGRSLTIWKDEASMMEWVVSKAHRDVMPLAGSETHGWETTHWSGSTPNEMPTFDDARSHLNAARTNK